MNSIDSLIALASAWLGSLLLTPLAARVAQRLGAVDAPDGRRKNQAAPVPLGGGLAIAMAAAIGLGLAGVTIDGFSDTFVESAMIAALPSAAVLIVVGLIDDAVGLTGIYKLIGQMLSATLLIAAGFRFESLSFFGLTLPLDDFSIPFSIFFCLGAINAFNLIDGSDGLASSIGAVVCLTLGVVAGFQGMVVSSLLSFAMSGALLGFLRYNSPPARVYLGDTGSMLIGWLVAAVAIRSSIKEQAAIALTVPIAICAIPIFDSLAAIIRRITTGQSVFTPDRGHLHHAFMLRGWSVGQTAALAAGLTAITCAGAVTSYFTRNDIFAVAAAIGVFTLLAATRVFGHSEIALLASHAKSALYRLLHVFRPSPAGQDRQPEQAIQLQGRRHWNVLWAALREAAPGYNLAGIKLNVNIPHLHESFYASWKLPGAQPADESWRVTLPLSYDDRPIGKLAILGNSNGAKGLAEMQQLLEYLEPMQAEITRIIEEAQSQQETIVLPAGKRFFAMPPSGAKSPVAPMHR